MDLHEGSSMVAKLGAPGCKVMECMMAAGMMTFALGAHSVRIGRNIAGKPRNDRVLSLPAGHSKWNLGEQHPQRVHWERHFLLGACNLPGPGMPAAGPQHGRLSARATHRIAHRRDSFRQDGPRHRLWRHCPRACA